MPKILGIDIGSLTIKAAALQPLSGEVEALEAADHGRQPVQAALDMLERLVAAQDFSGLAFTGYGGESLARTFGARYVNPHLASAEANMRLYPHLRTILNIGASSSNLIIIKEDAQGNPRLDDIRLPPHCSAGTGSFLSQSSSRLGFSIEEFGRLALESKNPETISGTCAVFAGSDMIDRQQKGARKEDIAAGLHYALARYLLGTLSRGKKLEGPFSFQGGVAENAGMRKALEDVLCSSGNRIPLFLPPHHRFLPAIGAAMLAGEKIPESNPPLNRAWLRECAGRSGPERPRLPRIKDPELPPLKRNGKIIIRRRDIDGIPVSSGSIPVFLGVDVGSVSTSVAVLYYGDDSSDRDWRLIAKRYLPTQGHPLRSVRRTLSEVQAELGDKILVADVAVTGSGRKLIAHYLGGVWEVNEITAHRTAAQTVAERMGAAVDEIIEIGGQDSKYIRGLEQFDMNKSCAAGTGSFIEEQTKQLGVGIQDFAPLALRARSPVSLGNKKCAVFIEEELAARQGQKSLEDLLASAAYAVAENYLDQFRIGDRSGKTIFFQGGVALNDAVVAALQHLTGATLVVPEHNEVMGSIGAAIHARRRRQGPTKFIGLEKIEKRDSFLDSFLCDGCANLCHVSHITTSDGATLYGGDRCEKYALSTGQKTTPRQKSSDLFEERHRLLRADEGGPEYPSRASRPKIGIPRLFSQYYEFYPLWKAFFESLGFDVVTSGRTNKKIVALGLNRVVAETCFPAEIVYGHLQDLADKRVDGIFFPSLIDGPRTRWKERKTHFCTLSQNMPFAATCTSSGHSDIAPLLIRPALRLHADHINLEREMAAVAERLGRSRKAAGEALHEGLEALARFKRRLRARGREVWDGLDRVEFPVAVVGRSYTLEDPGINVDLPKMIRDAGGFPLPLDFLPLEDTDISDVQNLANWRYYHRVMRAAEIVRTNPKLSSIFFSVFSCGPDAFLEEFYREALGGKPFLGIEVGKTTAPAHVQTRVEAFMDSLRESARTISRPVPPKARLTVHTPRRRRVLYVPRMDEDVPVFCEILKWLDIEARPLDASTPQSLALANRFLSGKTCLPARMTAGDYLHFLLNSNTDPEKIAFFNHQADGACRQKLYSLLQELVFRRLGFGSVPVITPTPGDPLGYTSRLELITGGKKPSRFAVARFFSIFWRSLVALETFRQLVLSRRPYEVRKGSTDNALEAGLKGFCRAVGRGKIKRAALDCLEKIMRVPLHPERHKVNIGIVGEGYVRLHGPSNHDTIKHLEELGAVTVLPMVTSFLNYSLENAVRRSKSRLLKIIKFLKEHTGHSLIEKASPHLIFPEPSAARVIGEATKFLDPLAAGEAVEGIGTASLYRNSGRIHGILNLIPAHCMAGSALQCYLEKLHMESGIPVLTLALDGIYDHGFRTNLELLVHKARLYRTGL